MVEKMAIHRAFGTCKSIQCLGCGRWNSVPVFYDGFYAFVCRLCRTLNRDGLTRWKDGDT